MNEARQKVQGPAIGLLVTGIIGILVTCGNVVWNIIQLTAGTAASAATAANAGFNNNQNAMMAFMSGTPGLILGIAFGLIGIAVGAFIIFAGLKMKNLQNWTVCMAASIVAMIPCISPCCCIGLPVGIWAVMVLIDPQVKAAFLQRA